MIDTISLKFIPFEPRAGLDKEILDILSEGKNAIRDNTKALHEAFKTAHSMERLRDSLDSAISNDANSVK